MNIPARHDTRRIGRILMATGRDATDVALSTNFARSLLSRFEVVTDEVPSGVTPRLFDKSPDRPA